MRKINKTKKGFTLIEMVMVIAIIILLASVVTFNAVEIYNGSKSGQSDVEQSQNKMTQGIQASEQMLADHNF
ncbi:MAG: type II secretion system protein [Clostridiales bacterium]|jgi:type IV pilus assembly protein PilA|nr:type II secretion system protein [Clostridiales bacterium]